MSTPYDKSSYSRGLNSTNFQDLTVNQSGLPCSPKERSRGPEKMVSPGRVRTMKEYEEQLAELKKENFNLKLRIYFIEERQEQMKGLKDVDELFKKNLELSCELENLKKDLSEKEELLLQSAKAMEILQNQHKKQIEEIKQTSYRDKTYLEDHINNLQKILREKEETINQFDDSSAMYAMAFGFNKSSDPSKEVEELKIELTNVTRKVVSLEEQLGVEENKYTALESELELAHEESAKLKNKISALETDVEKRDARLQQAYLDLDRKTEQLNSIKNRKNEKPRIDQLVEKELKISELETKIGELERLLQLRSNSSPSAGNRKINSGGAGEVTSSSKDGSPISKLKRDEKILSKQLQDARTKLVHLEEETQGMQTKLQEAHVSCEVKEKDIVKLQEEYHKACLTIQSLLRKNKQREKDVVKLQTEIEKKEKLIEDMSLPSKGLSSMECGESFDKNKNLKPMLESNQGKHFELSIEQQMESIKPNFSEMETEIQNLRRTLQEKDTRLKELEDKLDVVSKFECNDYKASDIQSKLEEVHQKLESIRRDRVCDESDCDQANSLKNDNLLVKLESKNQEVDLLKSELRRMTFNLQELVNKELWDKNREIEKLNKLCERRQIEISQLKKQIDSKDLQISFGQDKFNDSTNFSNSYIMRDAHIMNIEEIKENCNPACLNALDDKKSLKDKLFNSIEEKKFLIRKIEELEERWQNMPERDNDSHLINTLKSDLIKSKQEVENAEKSRKEVINACSLLTNRLQELADFLDSLLPSLGAKKRRVVKHAVERSRELSKSFSAAADDNKSWQNLQPSLYTSLLPDFSTVDFWSGDDITDLTLEEEANDEIETISQLRSKIGFLEEELKQRDQVSKVHNSLATNLHSTWRLDTNEFASLGLENTDFSKLALMFESLDTNENFNEVMDDKLNDDFDSFISGKNNILLKNNCKSSNIGEIVITSKKVSAKEDKNVYSESEAWSEPDRSVSLARIGLSDDTARSWGNDDSSDTNTDTERRNSLGGKRLKHDPNEIKKLQNKIRILEETNETLKGELKILYQLAPPALTNNEDKSTSIGGMPEVMSVSPNVLEEIRIQREKLETAIHHNANIRNQLETIFVSMKAHDRNMLQSDVHKESSENSSNLIELENKCKMLETQCSDLESALYSERSVCKQKEELCLKLERDFTISKEEQNMFKEKAELLQSKISELSEELRTKCNDLFEKQNTLLELQITTQKQYNMYENQIKDVENRLIQERDRWLKNETEIQSKVNLLQMEYDELKLKLKDSEREKKEIISQFEDLKAKNNKNKIQLKDLITKLEESNIKEENLLIDIDSWKSKWRECQRDAEETKRCLQNCEMRLFEMDRVNSQLKNDLQNQVDAATRQVAQTEYIIKDLEMKHKLQEKEWRHQIQELEWGNNEKIAEWRRQLDSATLATSEMVLERTRLANDKLRLQQEIRSHDTSHLEKVKVELERRVAELEAANNELEARLSTLKVSKMPSDSETDEQDNAPNYISTKHINWPSTSSSPPLSPLNKPTSLNLPLTSKYIVQKSNEISSDYMSDQDNCQLPNSVFWTPVTPIASPDLGIESDQGRLSSLENNSQPHTTRIEDEGNELAKLEEENVYLRQQLMRTRQALENTLSQLTASNYKKRQVERAICKQLGKTHQILKKARCNLQADAEGS